MCEMCESDNYVALRQFENHYYNNTTMAQSSLNNTRRPAMAHSISPRTSVPSYDQMALRRGSLSTCFNSLHIQQQQAQTESPPTFSKPNFAHPTPANLLSPPSSPRSLSLSLLAKVSEVDEQQTTHEEEEPEAQPCRRFQRQILSRLQVLNQAFPQAMEQESSTLYLSTNLHETYQPQEATTSRYTPPPSPPPNHLHPHIDRSRRTSSTPSSRRGSFARPNRVRLPSPAELELGVLPPVLSPKGSMSALSGGRRRVSSPNPSGGATAHLSSKGGIKKVGSGCGKKIIGDTPFKSGWSFSTAYGKGN